jgi:two-component system OmpR family response regulator
LRILLLEDEPEMASALRGALHAYDAVVDHVSTLADADEAARSSSHDAILLDRQVPDGDGLSLIPKLRAGGIGTPVIVLTARGELDDRIDGLDMPSRSLSRSCWRACAPSCAGPAAFGPKS